MNREILFRGRDNHGKWHYSMTIAEAAVTDGKITHYYFGLCPYCSIPADTVGQYTGLKDKNGTKIFEGDIVLMPNYGKGKHKTAVYFNNGKFAVDGTNYSFKDLKSGKTLEVIGNIYDDPELINQGGQE